MDITLMKCPCADAVYAPENKGFCSFSFVGTGWRFLAWNEVVTKKTVRV